LIFPRDSTWIFPESDPVKSFAFCFAVGVAFFVCPHRLAAAGGDALAPWRSNVKVSAVAPKDGRHTMHSYFNTCPESPDGKFVLFYASTAADGHRGEVVIRERATGVEKVLATNINAEDAHRVACQQWVSGGRRVVFHGQRGGEWFTWCVDLDTTKERVLARGQLAGWSQPHADLVPLYSPHWNPGANRDLDLINVATGEKRTAVTVDALKQAYPEWFAITFGEQKPSIFFPILSPDLNRVFFKMALATGDDPRSKSASARQGLVCYSLAEKRFLYMNPKWGHPSWQPDSRHITEMHYTVFDSNDGSVRANPGMPTKAARAQAAAEGKAVNAPLRDVSGDHPSVSPDGQIVVTDTIMTSFDGPRNEWGVVLADTAGTGQIVVHRFDNSRGAKSWRVSHPHPVFSADGRRIYYNVSDGEFTRLFVAERAEK
jgi:Tol biopolymer transport system component